jgi:nicotinate-nucleotide adenylyltransferase
MRLGIFGGTFNPIHLGHLLLAETARDALQLDRVLFIPAARPPHKAATGLVPGWERLKLIQLAIRDHPAFAASEIELRRPGPSYSVETVRWLRKQLPAATLFLLIGQDMLAIRWVAWSELKRLCTIAAVRRPGSRGALRARGIEWLTMPQMGISSSDIRSRLRAGRSIRYLVPGAVERYLRQHRLYQRGGDS